MLEHLHAQPVQIDRHNYHRERQRHEQAVVPVDYAASKTVKSRRCTYTGGAAQGSRSPLPVVLDGGQEPVPVRWEQLGRDGGVEETREQRDAERDERRSHQPFSGETHLWIDRLGVG
jgi:hypothetical protein